MKLLRATSMGLVRGSGSRSQIEFRFQIAESYGPCAVAQNKMLVNFFSSSRVTFERNLSNVVIWGLRQVGGRMVRTWLGICAK
jgi:hypothetical protein